jgi:hypothetical protein
MSRHDTPPPPPVPSSCRWDGATIRLRVADVDTDTHGRERPIPAGTVGTVEPYDPDSELHDIRWANGGWTRWTPAELDADAERLELTTRTYATPTDAARAYVRAGRETGTVTVLGGGWWRVTGLGLGRRPVQGWRALTIILERRGRLRRLADGGAELTTLTPTATPPPAGGIPEDSTDE